MAPAVWSMENQRPLVTDALGGASMRPHSHCTCTRRDRSDHCRLGRQDCGEIAGRCDRSGRAGPGLGEPQGEAGSGLACRFGFEFRDGFKSLDQGIRHGGTIAAGSEDGEAGLAGAMAQGGAAFRPWP